MLTSNNKADMKLCGELFAQNNELKEEKGVFNHIYSIPAVSPQSSHSIPESLSSSTSAEKRIVACNLIHPHKPHLITNVS